MIDRLNGIGIPTLIGMRLSDIKRPEENTEFSKALVKIGLIRYDIDPRDIDLLSSTLKKMISDKIDASIPTN